MIDGATPFTRMPSFATCPFRKFHPVWIGVMGENHRIILAMFAVLHALGMFIADLFKSRRQLEAENLFLRHQLNMSGLCVPKTSSGDDFGF